jgi:hypothetical protein
VILGRVGCFAVAFALLCAGAVGCGDSSTRKVNPNSKFLNGLSGILPGKSLRREDLDGQCMVTFTGRCDVEIRASKAMVRRGKLRLSSGLKVTVNFVPKEGSGFQLSLDPTNKEVELAVRRGGGALTLECVPVAGQPCAVELVPSG